MILRAGLVVAAFLCFAQTPLAGQASASLGLGASLIRYEGFLTSGALVVAPSVRFDTPRLSFGGQGSWTAFESGNGVLQGQAAGAWRSASRGRWRVELSGSAGAAKYAEESGTGHLLGGARLHLLGRGGNAGGWVGVTAGRSFGGSAESPAELAVAGWTVRHRLALIGTAAAAWLGPHRYLDVQASARWTGPRVTVEGRIGARPLVRGGTAVGEATTGGFGEVSALVSVTRRLAVALSGGSYPSDPARRVLGAKYLSAAVRVPLLGGVTPSPIRLDSWIREDRTLAPGASAATLVLAGSAERRVVRIRIREARSVELMADFTDWEVVPLARVGCDRWEVTIPVPAGVHRVNLRIDGGPWLAPAGVRVERTEFGGLVGVVVVP
jgi:hypothetical protein